METGGRVEGKISFLFSLGWLALLCVFLLVCVSTGVCRYSLVASPPNSHGEGEIGYDLGLDTREGISTQYLRSGVTKAVNQHC